MLEDHVKYPILRRRLRAGPAADYVDGFADWLHHLGYKPSSIEHTLRALADWADWLGQAGFAVIDAFQVLDVYKSLLAQPDRDSHVRGRDQRSLTAANRFIRFLQERGVLPCLGWAPTPAERWPIIGEFRAWMQQQRGLRESSLNTYERVLIDLLRELGETPLSYSANQVRNFVLKRAMPHGISRAKSTVTATRAFLRFLAATGRCPVGLDHAIPGYASWKLSTVPRFLEPADVQCVLDACVAKDARGQRDRAVLLLLARLGLRAGEVAGLTFRDIDWGNGRIAVCGKTRRQEWLPLPQEVGNAILRYLREFRPALKSDRVFARVHASLGPLTRGSVTDIARSALRRAGVKAPINGAHVFRHSAATAMLRGGASLAAIGAVLRHRSPSTTAHYAKIDFDLLAEVAQPWPQEMPC